MVIEKIALSFVKTTFVKTTFDKIHKWETLDKVHQAYVEPIRPSLKLIVLRIMILDLCHITIACPKQIKRTQNVSREHKETLATPATRGLVVNPHTWTRIDVQVVADDAEDNCIFI
jgi:hypothetical protein